MHNDRDNASREADLERRSIGAVGWLIALALVFGLVAMRAAWGVGVRPRAYIEVTVSPTQLDLGSVAEPGVFDSASELKVHVATNVAIGGVFVSVTPLLREGGGTIEPGSVFVRVPATQQYVSLGTPVIVGGPWGPALYDIPLRFRVQTTLAQPPGQYTGTLVITCIPAP